MLARVSNHAVIGYVRCALGVTLDDDDDLHACATAHAAAAGYTLAQVRALILTPTVDLGIRLGATLVRSDTIHVHLRRTNGVVFVGAISKPGNMPALRDRTNDLEGRRTARRYAVAAKRKPSFSVTMREWGEA